MIPAELDDTIEVWLSGMDDTLSDFPNDVAVEAWETIIEYAVLAKEGLTHAG
jgi:hypothetical protein